MPGGTQTYHCAHCPLIVELGGSTVWETDLAPGKTIPDFEVVREESQVACAACGTMHRITQERGSVQLSALPGPIREFRTVILHGFDGEDFESRECATEADWGVVVTDSNSIDPNELACAHCGRVGMLSLETFLYPGGHVSGRIRREQCPVCAGPMECVGVTDWV